MKEKIEKAEREKKERKEWEKERKKEEKLERKKSEQDLKALAADEKEEKRKSGSPMPEDKKEKEKRKSGSPMPEERKGAEDRQKPTEKRNSRLDRSPNREPIPVADLRAMTNADIEEKMKDIKSSLVRDHSELEDVMQEGNEDLLDVCCCPFSTLFLFHSCFILRCFFVSFFVVVFVFLFEIGSPDPPRDAAVEKEAPGGAGPEKEVL